MIETKLKLWQKGIPLAELKEMVKRFEPYNAKLYGGTTRVNQLKLADWMDKGEVVCGERYVFRSRVLKTLSPGFLYRGARPQVPTHHKLKGDRILDHLALAEDAWPMVGRLIASLPEACWLELIARDRTSAECAQALGFKRVAVSVASEGDIFHIWFRPAVGSVGLFPQPPRVHPPADVEYVNVKKLPFRGFTQLIGAIDKKLDSLPAFKQHDGTKYNKDNNSWSAISLRGFSLDPLKMLDPAEMPPNFMASDRGDGYTLDVHNTPIWKQFPEVEALLRKLVPGWSDRTNPFFRVRFMALRDGEGELRRHTDLTDPSLGFGKGKRARLHFPIRTNPKVEFTSWNVEDEPTCVNMREGECWYLNIRLPHRAINAGDRRRVHLVVDVLSDCVRQLIEN